MTPAHTKATRSASPPRTRARKGEGERLRDEILDATEQLLLETGSEEAVSIRGVAERVGVTPPSIYRHFEDKATLMLEVCRLEFRRLHDAIAVGAISGNPLAEVRRQGEAYVHFAIAHPEHYRIMLLTRPPIDKEQFIEEFFSEESAFELLREAIGELLELDEVRPEIKAMGELEVSFLLWSAVHGISSLVVTKPDLPWPDIDQLVGHQLDLVAFGLLRTP